jgi:hypothetical protein
MRRHTTGTLGVVMLLAAATAGAATSEEIGDEIGAVYVRCLEDVTAAMEGLPPAAELEPEVVELRDACIDDLVELGRQRQGFDTSQNATVNAKVGSTMRRVPSELFQQFSERQFHYQKSGDRDLAKLIADFNVITQYADFELLKTQSPKEAERLGIE